MNKIMMEATKNVAKLGLAGGAVFGIAFAFVTLNPEEPVKGVQDAQADIADFSAMETSESAKFTNAMKSLGLRPKAYDFNGNVLYFSSGYSEKAPRELLPIVQNTLVAAGVNEKDHTETRPVQEGLANVRGFFARPDAKKQQTDEKEKALWDQVYPGSEAMMKGDVVPTIVSDKHVRMVGYESREKFDDPKTFFAGDHMKQEDPTAALMGGYKFFEAQWEDGPNMSTITAVWSAEDFEAERMDGPGDSPPDPNVPACVGCERDYRVQSLEKDEPFQANMYSTKSSVPEVYEFYRTAMENRGWREGGVQPKLQAMERYMPELHEVNKMGRVLSLEKDGQTLQLAILPDGNISNMDGTRRTTVLTNHEMSGGQVAPSTKMKKKGAGN